MVEFSPATRETRVRFPASASFHYAIILFSFTINGQSFINQSLTHSLNQSINHLFTNVSSGELKACSKYVRADKNDYYSKNGIKTFHSILTKLFQLMMKCIFQKPKYLSHISNEKKPFPAA